MRLVAAQRSACGWVWTTPNGYRTAPATSGSRLLVSTAAITDASSGMWAIGLFGEGFGAEQDGAPALAAVGALEGSDVSDPGGDGAVVGLPVVPPVAAGFAGAPEGLEGGAVGHQSRLSRSSDASGGISET